MHWFTYTQDSSSPLGKFDQIIIIYRRRDAITACSRPSFASFYDASFRLSRAHHGHRLLLAWVLRRGREENFPLHRSGSILCVWRTAHSWERRQKIEKRKARLFPLCPCCSLPMTYLDTAIDGERYVIVIKFSLATLPSHASSEWNGLLQQSWAMWQSLLFQFMCLF